jgi:hypothetical protein
MKDTEFMKKSHDLIDSLVSQIKELERLVNSGNQDENIEFEAIKEDQISENSNN